MTELTEQLNPTFRLLDLPDATIDSTVRSLADEDKISFMAVSRKAAHVTMLSAKETTLKITKDTMFPGIRQVIKVVL